MKRVRLVCAMALVFCVVVFVSGCAMMPGGIAASTVPIEGRSYSNLGRSVGTDSRYSLLGLIPVSGPNTTREAIDSAVKTKGGDAMINVTAEGYGQWGILVTRWVTRVDGEGIKFDDGESR